MSIRWVLKENYKFLVFYFLIKIQCHSGEKSTFVYIMPPSLTLGIVPNPLAKIHRRRRPMNTTTKNVSLTTKESDKHPSPQAGRIQDIYPSSRSSSRSPNSLSLESIYSTEKEFYGSKDDTMNTPPTKSVNKPLNDYYFTNKTEIESKIEKLKQEIATNVKCKEVDKYRMILKKRGSGGFELPKEPDYSTAQSISEITQKQKQYLDALKQYINYCNNPNISLRLHELRQGAIDAARTKKNRYGGSTRRKKRRFHSR